MHWDGNLASDQVRKLVALEVVLCQVRNAHVTKIDASRNDFDDADATRIAEALRCDIPYARACVRMCMCICACVSVFVCVCVCVRARDRKTSSW